MAAGPAPTFAMLAAEKKVPARRSAKKADAQRLLLPEDYHCKVGQSARRLKEHSRERNSKRKGEVPSRMVLKALARLENTETSQSPLSMVTDASHVPLTQAEMMFHYALQPRTLLLSGLGAGLGQGGEEEPGLQEWADLGQGGAEDDDDDDGHGDFGGWEPAGGECSKRGVGE